MRPLPLLALLLLAACSTGDSAPQAESIEPTIEPDGGTGSDGTDGADGSDGTDGTDPVELGLDPACSPFNAAGDCLTPWPSVFHMAEDPDSETGLRLDYGLDMLTGPGDELPVDPGMFNRYDGVSVTSPLLMLLGRDVHPDQLFGLDQEGASLAEPSPYVLLHSETGERVPLHVEMDQNNRSDATYEGRHALILRPMTPLEPGAVYTAAISTALTDTDGAPFAASPGFEALRDGVITTDDRIEGVRASSSAAGAVLSMVGFLCAATGVAAPAALVFHGAGVVVKSGTRAVSTLFDWRRADEALAVLNDARAGDADARKLLFATHGRYACALVALMAKEGDPIALSIFNHHGVDAAAVQKAFPGLLKRFLMTTLKEKDKPKGWDHQVKKLQKIGAAVPGMLSGGAEFLALRGTALSGLAYGWLSEKRRVQTQLAMLAFSTQTDDYVRRGMEQLLEWRDGMETLDDELSDLRFEGKADTDAYRARQKLLVTLRSQYNESIVKSRELRDTIAAQLKQALELMETLMASPEGIDEEARGRFLAIVQQDQATLAYLAFVH